MLEAVESLPPRRSFLSRLRGRLPFRSQSHRRLQSSLAVFSKELDVLAGPAAEPWTAAARDLLEEARRALGDHDPERGWQSFFAAQRLSLYGLKTKEDLTAKARLVLAEGESKLKGWRKQAVAHLLAKAEPGPDVCILAHLLAKTESGPDVFAVALAQQTLQEHYTNEYEKLRSIRRQTGQLCVIALAALLAILLLLDADLRILVILFGILGAAFSGVLSLANASEKRIPQLLLHFSAAMARVSLGGVAAYVVFTFLNGGVLTFEAQNQNAILALSFAAGFSERLLVRAVKAASG